MLPASRKKYPLRLFHETETKKYLVKTLVSAALLMWRISFLNLELHLDDHHKLISFFLAVWKNLPTR